MKKLNKIAVIPDVHGKLFWKNAKDKVDSLDKIIFLGDYLDSYSFLGFFSREDELNNFIEILDFKKAFPEKVTLLLGNHDIGYLLDLGCSRQESGDMRRNYKNLFERNINLFKLTEYVELANNEKILFSHAGIHEKWLDKVRARLEQLGNKLGFEGVPLIDSIINGLFNKIISEFYEPEYKDFLRWSLGFVGPARGGFYGDYGSIIWADASEWKNEKNIFGDIKQIFGHTRLNIPKNLTEGVRCIDTVDSEILYLGE